MPALRVAVPPEGISTSYYKYYVFLRPERLRTGWNRDRILSALVAEKGIFPCGSRVCGELYREKAFAGLTPTPGGLPTARELAETSIMLLVHPTLKSSDVKSTARTFKKVLAAAAN